MWYIGNDESPSLSHHGILGMKWGIRRYQNSDGSLTAAGKKRYGYNLDVDDKSRSNIAQIRLGEARRRLDTSKANNSTNTSRIAQLKRRERLAKAQVKTSKQIDKGAERVAKGETIMGNNVKSAFAYVGASAAAHGLTSFLNMRMRDLASQGRWTGKHQAVAEMINKYGSYGIYGLSTAYSMKKSYDNANIRKYNSAQWNGENTIKRVGSEEYRDRIESEKKKKK